MKVNVREWLAMHPVKRYIKIQEVAHQNDVSIKAHKKSLQALACK